MLAVLVATGRADGSAYTWRNVNITAGGFVPGLTYHPTEPGLLYARTDVGGVFRYDASADRWVALQDAVDRAHWQWLGIASLALDPTDPARVYLAAGSYPQIWGQPGAFLRSDDRGRTWETIPLPFKLPGNADGRGTGERLLVQPDAPATLWLGTPDEGLWRSPDRGTTWSRVAALGASAVTSVWSMPPGAPASPAEIWVAVQAPDQPVVWRSADGGATWEAVPGQPNGLVVHRTAVDASGDLYLTYCDALGPGGIQAGALWRYRPRTGAWSNLTPALAAGRDVAPHGFGGLAADPQTPGVILVASLYRWHEGNEIWRTTDGGLTWRSCFDGATWDHAGVAYAAPFRPHWMSSLAIDPHRPHRVWFTTGYGLWTTDDIAPAGGQPVHWRFANRDLEETVVDELVSPPEGAPLLSALGDVGGFRHDDLDTSPRAGALQPERGSSTSIAFAARQPLKLVRTHHGAARAARSDDGGVSWRDVAAVPSALGGHGNGSLVLNADASRLLWLPQDCRVQISTDDGATWHESASDFTAPGGHRIARLAADQVDPLLGYAYDPASGRFFVSQDGGGTWTLRNVFAPEGGIIRAEPRQRGVVWIPAEDGLYVSSHDGEGFRKLVAVDAAYQVGFGRAAAGADCDTVFMQGRVRGVEGVYRSTDSGANWTRIDDPTRRYGWLRAVIGDGQVFGRCYLATSGRGIIVGEPN